MLQKVFEKTIIVFFIILMSANCSIAKTEIEQFNICEDSTINVIKENQLRELKLNELEEKLGKNSEQLLKHAYEAMIKFVESKVSNEEGHGGSIRLESIAESEQQQKQQYLELIEQIHEGFIPSPENTFEKADKRLDKIYKKIINTLAEKPYIDFWFAIEDEDIQEDQQLWMAYRDASVELFVCINPSVKAKVWKSWLTEIREKQLKELLSLIG